MSALTQREFEDSLEGLGKSFLRRFGFNPWPKDDVRPDVAERSSDSLGDGDPVLGGDNRGEKDMPQERLS